MSVTEINFNNNTVVDEVTSQAGKGWGYGAAAPPDFKSTT